MNVLRISRAWLLCLLLSVPLAGFSQEAAVSPDYTRFLFGAGASVIFSQPVNITIPTENHEGQFSSRGATGYGVSLNTRLDLMPNLFLSIGVQYSEIGYQLRYDAERGEPITQINNSQSSVGVPIVFYYNPFNPKQQYKMFKNRWKLFFTGGVNMRYAWNTHNTITYNGLTPTGRFELIQEAEGNQLNPLLTLGGVITSPYKKWGVVDLFVNFNLAMNTQTPTTYLYSNANSNGLVLSNASSRLGFLNVGMVYYPFRARVKTGYGVNYNKYNGKDCPNGPPEDPTPAPFKTF